MRFRVGPVELELEIVTSVEVEEIDLAVHAVDDLPTLCGLVMARRRLVERVAGYPGALAIAWAHLGEWERARYLAEIDEPDLLDRAGEDRLRYSLWAAEILSDEEVLEAALALDDPHELLSAAEVMARRGRAEPCQTLLDAADALLESMEADEFVAMYGDYLVTLARCGQVEEALESAPALPGGDERDRLLVRLAEFGLKAVLEIGSPSLRVVAYTRVGTAEFRNGPRRPWSRP